MKMPWRLFITAMLFVAHTVAAAESESEEDERYSSATYGADCTEEHFSSFLERFSNDASIQREHTEYQLIKKEMDLSAAPEVRKSSPIWEAITSNHPYFRCVPYGRNNH